MWNLLPRVGLLAVVASVAFAGETPDFVPGPQKQLLVDKHMIDRTQHVQRVLGRVHKANNGRPIFRNGFFYGTVLHADQRFKMWFRRFDGAGYGYAESVDGLHFTKKADLVGLNFAGDINLAVELNRPDSQPSRRFLGGYDAPGMAAGIAHSADGIHWTPINDGKPVTFRAADCHNQIMWDPIGKTYRLFTRTDYGSGGGPLADTVAKGFEVRGTRGMTNPDILAKPKDWRIVRQWHFNREGDEEFLRRQLYSMTVYVYQGIYFGLMSVYEYPGDISEGRESDQQRRHERDVMNFYLATSRDCDSWDLTWVYAGQPIVPRGPDGSFDKDNVFPSSSVVTHDDRHWFYYAGSNERHGTAELRPPVWFEQRRSIGLATLPLDRFIGWHAGARPGVIVTKPFVVTAPKLLLNVAASQGQISAEVLDAAGQVLSGYGGDDSIAAKRVDQLRLGVRWKSKSDLSELMGQTVRLRLRWTLGDLYAFQLSE